MLEQVRRLPGTTLGLDAYRQEFRASWNRIEDSFWKLERQQTFSEHGDPGWEAMLEGRWDDALALIEDDRPDVMEYFAKAAALGFENRRLRIVQFPISPYLQWELHFLNLTSEAGEHTRVLDAGRVGALEGDGPLPELVILGVHVMFEVLYDDKAALSGGRLITDRSVIDACRAEMAALFEQAEDLAPFFEREIAPLPPPVPNRNAPSRLRRP